jgi:deoxycytidylate deaminase
MGRERWGRDGRERLQPSHLRAREVPSCHDGGGEVEALPLKALQEAIPGKSAQEMVLEHAANELVFGVVGHVGSGTSAIARQLKDQLSSPDLDGGPFKVEILKASKEIADWASANGHEVPPRAVGQLNPTTSLQDLGNSLRETSSDAAAVARRIVLAIRADRARQTGVTPSGAVPVQPDGKRRAWIVDSLRHPEEVELLRHIYQDAFVLIGVVCDESIRIRRLLDKYPDDGSQGKIQAFMSRDADESDKFGQKVADTFHLSDYFVNNSELREKEGFPNQYWDVPDQLGRLVRILTHADVVRPTIHETAMHAAYGAQLRSACLSRQVGAALVDVDGHIVATGSNEVPRSGGGVYGQRFEEDPNHDHRCAFRNKLDMRYCSNTKEQVEIIEDLIATIEDTLISKGGALSPEAKLALRGTLRKTRVGGLLEFSRAVHAEMDALLAAARAGASPVNGVLYVTTYPCHYCARHIVAAGVREVQYIEPYPKSMATKLHSDSIRVTRSDVNEKVHEKVLFRPFSGAAPRLYRRAFLKDRELKNKQTGNKEIAAPAWGSPWHLRGVSYVDLEAELSKEVDDAGQA